MTLPTTDHAHGIERNPASPEYGRQVLGGKGQIPIILWRRPGGMEIKEENFTGAVAHGQELKVIRGIEYEGEWWYYVTCSIRHEGRTYPQRGWVKRPLLKDSGNDTDKDNLSEQP